MLPVVLKRVKSECCFFCCCCCCCFCFCCCWWFWWFLTSYFPQYVIVFSSSCNLFAWLFSIFSIFSILDVAASILGDSRMKISLTSHFTTWDVVCFRNMCWLFKILVAFCRFHTLLVLYQILDKSNPSLSDFHYWPGICYLGPTSIFRNIIIRIYLNLRWILTKYYRYYKSAHYIEKEKIYINRDIIRECFQLC